MTILLNGGVHKCLGGNISAKINNFKAFAFHHHFYKILADVMQITLHSADANTATGFHTIGGQQGLKQCRTHIQCAGSNQYLGDKNLIIAEFFANDIHACDQTLFEDFLRGNAAVDSFLYQLLDDLCLALLQVFGNLRKHVFCLLIESI